MTRSHRIPRPALALAVASALLIMPAVARPDGHAHAQPAIVVPASPLNARWPREPAGGPLPASPAAPAAPGPNAGHQWTAASVAAGLLLLALCAGTATGVRLRPRTRRRVAA